MFPLLSESKESEFLSLSAPQLKTCADIACNERGGTVDIARKMLNYSLQICQVISSYRLLVEYLDILAPLTLLEL